MAKAPYLARDGFAVIFPRRFEIWAPALKPFTSIQKTSRGRGQTDYLLMVGAKKKVVVTRQKGQVPIIMILA